jgi:uncharacterized protein YjiS (DUF1127 family)
MALTIKSSRWVAADLAVHFVRDAALGIGAAVTALINRREAARALAKFDGRMLADIGLTRNDVESAFSEPLWRDPTSRLAVIAIERRCAARAARHTDVVRTEKKARLELVN